jgi:hypothetical protein
MSRKSRPTKDIEAEGPAEIAGRRTALGGFITTSASRWGASYKAENYYELLSNSTIDAVHGLLKNDAFKQAVQKIDGGQRSWGNRFSGARTGKV